MSWRVRTAQPLPIECEQIMVRGKEEGTYLQDGLTASPLAFDALPNSHVVFDSAISLSAIHTEAIYQESIIFVD